MTYLELYFRDLLLSVSHRHMEMTEDTEVYIVGMLEGFAHARVTDEALCLLLLRQTGDRVILLKEVGDTALFMTGFFEESFESKPYDPDYYIGLGESAYTELANRLTHSVLHEIFGELAEQFPGFVDLLRDMRQNIRLAGWRSGSALGS